MIEYSEKRARIDMILLQYEQKTMNREEARKALLEIVQNSALVDSDLEIIDRDDQHPSQT